MNNFDNFWYLYLSVKKCGKINIKIEIKFTFCEYLYDKDTWNQRINLRRAFALILKRREWHTYIVFRRYIVLRPMM